MRFAAPIVLQINKDVMMKRDIDRQTETGRQTETDRDRQAETDRQRQTETDRQRQRGIVVLLRCYLKCPVVLC